MDKSKELQEKAIKREKNRQAVRKCVLNRQRMVKELLHRKKTSSEETHRLVEEFKTLYLQKKDVDMQQKQRIIFSDKGVFEQWTYNRQMIHKNFSKAVNLQLLDEILAEERSARLGH